MKETSLWVDKYGEALKTTYMKEMERLFAQLNELSRRLERPLKDLDDIKSAIDILRKTRDLELDMDDAIDPIEVRLDEGCRRGGGKGGYSLLCNFLY